MNHNLAILQPYPFEKLNLLKAKVSPPQDKPPIIMSIGEPKHEAPAFIKDELTAHLSGLSVYPTTQGTAELRQSIATWLTKRFQLGAGTLDAERHVLPVNGTREALFAIAQCLIDASPDALVVMPNPFYQIYEGATLLAGAQPWFLNLTLENGFLPDFSAVPAEVWQRCQLVYLCSPGNPTGSVIPREDVRKLIELADEFDFVIAADECYSEIYCAEDEPVVGLLQVAAEMGRSDFSRCLVFHSLSKRSSVPGMRSGFVAGDGEVIEKFRLYRTYHGCSMPPPTQAASARAWQDEVHVRVNRALYREKFEAMKAILSPVTAIEIPAGGFYLWLHTPIDDQTFAQELYRLQNVTVLPGSYLSRTAHGSNPGEHYVRIALVPPLGDCIEAANRIKSLIAQLKEKV
jgi:N-succinyldiaminopimelate aminotransferase